MRLLLAFLAVFATAARAASTADSLRTQANVPIEITFVAARAHAEPFAGVQLDVAFTDPAGARRLVPAFWDGGPTWKARYASPISGVHRFRTICSDASDRGLQGIEGRVAITPYTGTNPLYRHGPIRVAPDRRHFRHADGAPFFWLGDTWWKCLCKRMTWAGFQKLTADRRAKGFSVVQIVCGPYPDEGPFEARWENEGGKPYLTHDFSRSNPAYFRYADRRIRHLVENGLVPAIVGGWGRGDCDGMKLAGVEGLKRHWRHLVARYGAYPAIWIVGGESGGPQWTEVARYLKQIDPYRHITTIHPAQSGLNSAGRRPLQAAAQRQR